MALVGLGLAARRARRPPLRDDGCNDDVQSDLAERAARLASAGAVGASVAHELRNALAVAESSLFLARRDLEDKASSCTTSTR